MVDWTEQVGAVAKVEQEEVREQAWVAVAVEVQNWGEADCDAMKPD